MKLNQKIQFVIDGILVTSHNKITVLQACEKIGIEIPRFCFHERLQIAGNCRICLVEVFKSPKPQASCALPVVNDIIIFTNSPLVKKARENVLEIILKNHPLDCPICDQGGECDLQEEAWIFGSPWSRFKEKKRNVLNKNLGFLIKTVINRCIHCTRCIRFAIEIAGIDSLGTVSRSEKTEISTYVEKLFDREISSNVIDLCPVGALTSKPYAFNSRPWELITKNRIDLTDSLGSNVIFSIRGFDILRIFPKLNEKINEEWLTDKARFCFDGFSVRRLLLPIIKFSFEFKEISFFESFFFLKKSIKKALFLNKNRKKKVIGIFSGELTDLETLIIAKGVTDSVKNSFVESRWNHLKINKQKFIHICADLLQNFGFSSTFQELEDSDLCLLIGVNSRSEARLINTRLRKGVYKKNLIIANLGPVLDLTFKVEHLGISLNSLLLFLEGKHFFCKKFLYAKKPFLIIGISFFITKNFNLVFLGRNLLKKRFFRLKLNLLHVKANDINSLFSGSIYNSKFKFCNLGFLLEKDNQLPFEFADNWVYVGSFVNEEILINNKLRLCLPRNIFIEKKSTFINLNKLPQKTNKIIFNFKNKPSFSILESLLFLMQKNKININSLINLEKNLKINLKSRKVEINFFSFFKKKKIYLNKPICILDMEQIYFQSNSFCRNSLILSKCGQNKIWENL